MRPDTAGKCISADRILASVRAYGQQKALAMDIGMTEQTLSRLLDTHVVQVCQLLDHLGLEVVQRGHVENLRKVLKECL